MKGGQTFEIDRAAGIVRIVGTGMWSPQDARAHFLEIEQALRPLRSAGMTLIFLVDMRKAVVQSQETAMAMRSGAMRMHKSTDIVAVVTSTMLHALQVKKVTSISRLATFSSMAEAATWAEIQRVPA